VFALVFSFFSACFFLLVLELEFLALLYITVYVGAILVLFLFITLSFNLKDLKYSKNNFYSKGFKIIYLNFVYNLFIESKLVYLCISTSSCNERLNFKNYFYFLESKVEDIQIFGSFLYTQLFLYLFIISLILLIVMIGVIIITIENNPYKPHVNYKSRKLNSILSYKI